MVVNDKSWGKYRGADCAIVNNDTRSDHCLVSRFFIHWMFIICLSHHEIMPADLHTQRYLDVEISREKTNRDSVSGTLQFPGITNVAFIGTINNVDHDFFRDISWFVKNHENLIAYL